MPRITELPPLNPNELTGNESIAVVQDGTTVQSKIYRARYSRMLPLTNEYTIGMRSYEGNGYTSFAEMKFYQNGVEIPSTSIISIEFVGTPPLSLTGSLESVIDGDPETYVRFQYDINRSDTLIKVIFNSADIVVDEIRVTAPSLASGVSMLECPSFLFLISGEIGDNMQYSFNTYDNPSNDWEDAWTPGQTKTVISPELLSNPYVPLMQVSSVTPPSIPQVYAGVQNCDNIIFKFPRVAVDVRQRVGSIPGVTGANGLPVKLGSATMEIEVLAHRENTAVIYANGIPADNTLSQSSFYQFDSAYTANTLVFRNNGTSDVTLILVPGNQFTDDLYSPLHSKKTLINTSPNYNVTLDVSAFATVIGSGNLVVPPLSVVHFMEYADGEIAVWK